MSTLPRRGKVPRFSQSQRLAIRQHTVTLMASHFADGFKVNMVGSTRRYREFCLQMGEPAFPVTFDKVAGFITEKIMRGNKLTSGVTDSRNIKSWCIHHGVDYMPDAEDRRQFKTFVSGASAATDMSVKRPPPMTYRRLRRIFGVLDVTDPDDHQFWCCLVLSHSAMLRGGGACGRKILVKHLKFTRDGWLTVTLVKRKHNRHGPPETVPVPPQSEPMFNTVGLLKDYLRRSGLRDQPWAPVFPQLRPSGRARRALRPRWSYDSWLTAYKRMSDKAGVKFSTPQGTRAGGFTDLVEGGMPELIAARVGGWAPPGGNHPRYLRQTRRGKGAMLHKARSRQIARSRGREAPAVPSRRKRQRP